jgi:DNA polymerase-1
MTQPEVYLVDGSAYIYRAYHAIRPLSNSAGLPTHAVFGFASMLKKLLRERQPQCLAVAFDTRGPVFRHQLYAEYKANRPPMPEDLVPQVPYIRKLVQAYNIPMMEHENQEADDLIAAAADKLVQLGCKVVIVSGDKDLLQLVGRDVTMWDPMNDRIMDEAAVEKKYGITPDNLLDYFALTGDSADNVPGVAGVGPKTAQKLISAYQSLEGLYQSIGELKPSKMTQRIIDNRDNAFLSRDLIRLNKDAEVPQSLDQYRHGEPHGEDLRALLTELEFFSLLKTDVPAAAVDVSGFCLVQDEKTLAEVGQVLKEAACVVIDTETDSLVARQANLVGLSLCVDKKQAWYIPCGHRDEQGELVAGQLDLSDILQELRPVFEDAAVAKVGHNLKYDLAVLDASQNGGVILKGPLYDTMIGAWLIEPDRRSYKLDDLCKELDVRLTPFDEVVKGDKKADAFSRVGLEAARDYSCEDVYGSLLLFEHQKPQLEELGLFDLFSDIEGPLVSVLAAMEKQGIQVDGEVLKGLSIEFAQGLEDYEQEIYRVAGKEFNIQSPKQLGVILFEDLGLPKGRKTKTGYSTDVKVLEKLSKKHELPALILQYRNLAKLKSTYVDKLTELCDPHSGRVHTSYNQCGTATGRLSSSNPNLQNIPIRTEEGRRIRAAFIAPPGSQLLAGDYSQIDLRVMAHYCQDKALVEAFVKGQDVHRQTAAEVFDVDPTLVTADMRRVAKTINFGIVYGMSSFGLSSQLDISRKEAQMFIDRYFAHYQGIKVFMETVVEKAREDGYVTTLLGRRRMLPDIHSKNKNKREFAERMAINTPIQGTAADIIKLAMLKVSQLLQANGLQARMILQIHDELVLEVPEEELAQVRELLKQTMEKAFCLDVPLVVNLECSQNLGKD